jgi:hypothetical protein
MLPPVVSVFTFEVRIPALNVSTAVAVSGDPFIRYKAFAWASVKVFDDVIKKALLKLMPVK